MKTQNRIHYIVFNQIGKFYDNRFIDLYKDHKISHKEAKKILHKYIQQPVGLLKLEHFYR